MPHPHKGEHQADYIPRCMADPEMNSKFPDAKQRAAVCYSYFRDKSVIEAADFLDAVGGLDGSGMTEPQKKAYKDGCHYHAKTLHGLLERDNEGQHQPAGEGD